MNQLYFELGASLASGKFIRNIIEPFGDDAIKQFRGKHNNTDVYTTVLKFDKEQIREGKQTGPLYFDFDNEFALDDLRDVMKFFIKHGCPKESIHVYYSGSKGFHLEIPFEALRIDPSQELHKLYEVVAKEIKRQLHLPSLDEAIYDAVRLWRLPNSINSKSGLYKIPLTSEETELPLDQIKEFAKAPRDDFKFPVPIIWEEFTNVISKAKKRLRNTTYKGGVFEPAEEGQRNDRTFRRAIRLKAEGKSLEETLQICTDFPDRPPLSPSEIERTVASAYQDKYVVTALTRKRHDEEDNSETTSFFVSKDGVVYEEVFDPKQGEPLFAIYDGKSVSYAPSIELEGKVIKPINDVTVTKKLTKLPTEAVDYHSETQLFSDIKNFIHTYVDIDENWEYWSSYYVLLSWIYDKLPVCPYLCALGGASTGKTRFIQTVGAICYKPFTASGSITASPIFRILDRFRGTLIVNEFDHIGEFNQEIIVIFNNGFEADLPVIRTEGEEKKEVKVFQVYGPKLFSARKRKSDWAFESRLLTIQMRETKRKDIPPFLLADFHQLAEELRNMLLMFRFKHYNQKSEIKTNLFPNIRGRLRQTLLSITSVIHDDVFLEKANEFAKEMEKNLKTIKEFDLDTFTYRVLVEYWEGGERMPAVKDVAEKVKKLTDFEKLSAKAIGNIVRDEFGFETKRGGVSGNYVILLSSEQLDYLRTRYEVAETDTATEENSVSSESPETSVPDTEVTEQTELDMGNVKEAKNDGYPY